MNTHYYFGSGLCEIYSNQRLLYSNMSQSENQCKKIHFKKFNIIFSHKAVYLSSVWGNPYKSLFIGECMSPQLIDPSEFPLGCELELTYKCNQQCLYCFNDSGLTKPEELSISQWIEVSKEFSGNGVFDCVLQGGEPFLLGENLYKIMDVFYDHNVRILLVSNGVLIDETNIDKLTKYEYSRFQISVGGPTASVHEHDRGAPHTFSSVINACVLASQAGLPLTISYTVTTYNVDYIEDMVHLSYMVGADHIIIAFLVPVGRGFTHASELCIPKKRKEEAQTLVAQLHETFKGRLDVTMQMDTAKHLHLCTKQNPSTLLIRPNGDVKLDWLLPFKLGDIKTASVTDIWNRMGKTAWSHPQVTTFVESLICEEDFLDATPRPHVDEDILLT